MVSSDEDDQKIAAIAKDTKTHHLQEVEPEKPPGDLLLPESFENKKFAKRSRAIKHEKNRSMKKKKIKYENLCEQYDNFMLSNQVKKKNIESHHIL